MAKKIALFFSLIMIFSLSFVFASEDTVTSGENVEVVSGEVAEEIVSGETDTTTETKEDITTSGENITTNENDHDHDHEVESNNTIVGAIVAIIIVVAVVAIVAVLQKK